MVLMRKMALIVMIGFMITNNALGFLKWYVRP